MTRSFIITLFGCIINLFGNVLMFANVDISGNVCDKNNQPIDSVRVDIISTDTTTVYTNSEGYFDVSIITGIGKNISSPDQDVELIGQNFPNPFATETTIKVGGSGTLQVFNIIGHKVFEYWIDKVNARINLSLSPGIYLYGFIDDHGKKSDTKRMVLLIGGKVSLNIIQNIEQTEYPNKKSEHNQIQVLFSHPNYFSSDTVITIEENNPVVLNLSLFNKRINLILEEAYRGTGLISADSGGIVEAISSKGVKYRLNIPPRALLSDIKVDLVPVKGVTNLPLPSQFIAAVDVQSDSLDLMMAATLTIELPNQVPEKVIGFHSQGDGSRFHLSPMRVDGNIIQFVTFNFSPLGFLQCACDNITAYDYPSQNQLERGKQRIALLNSLSSNCEVYNVEQYEEAYMDIHYDWFFAPNDGVSSFINQSEINLDPASLKLAVREFLAWHNSLYYHQDVEITPDLVDFKAIPGCIVDGGLCENLQDVANAAVVRLWDIIEYLIWDLNNACSAGDQKAENQALRLINLADVLVNRPYIDDVSYDIEELVALKTCGVNSIILQKISTSLGSN